MGASVRYVIVGAGAVGGVLGARLHAAGRDVTLVARGEHGSMLQRAGLRLLTPYGTEVHHIPTVANVAESGLRQGDVLILAVKSQDTATVLEELATCAPTGLAVVCAQNGVGNEREALRRHQNVYAMCVHLPGVHLRPGIVIQSSTPVPGLMDVGRYPHGLDAQALALSADLRAASFDSETDPLVMRRKYRKLLVNLVNALDALCGKKARESPLAAQARAEGAACLTAARIDVAPAISSSRAITVTPQPVAGHAEAGSSSWQSLARGTGTIEADWLNGEIVMLGRLHGVPTPVNELLQTTVAQAATAGWQPGAMTVEELSAHLA